jgi:hypothetical protein
LLCGKQLVVPISVLSIDNISIQTFVDSECVRQRSDTICVDKNGDKIEKYWSLDLHNMNIGLNVSPDTHVFVKYKVIGKTIEINYITFY